MVPSNSNVRGTGVRDIVAPLLSHVRRRRKLRGGTKLGGTSYEHGAVGRLMR